MNVFWGGNHLLQIDYNDEVHRQKVGQTIEYKITLHMLDGTDVQLNDIFTIEYIDSCLDTQIESKIIDPMHV